MDRVLRREIPGRGPRNKPNFEDLFGRFPGGSGWQMKRAEARNAANLEPGGARFGLNLFPLARVVPDRK